MASFIGTRPEQVPTNQDLGPLAFLDRPFRRKVEVTATAGQTAFTVTGGYAPGMVDVYLNGVLLPTADYTETNSTTITLTAAAALNDELIFIVWWAAR